MIVGVDLSSLLVSDMLSCEFRACLYQKLDEIKDEIHLAVDDEDTIYNRTLERYALMYGRGTVHGRDEPGTAREKLLRVPGLKIVYHAGPGTNSWGQNNPPTDLTPFDYAFPATWPASKSKTYHLDPKAPPWKYTPWLDWIFDENGWTDSSKSPAYATKAGLSAVEHWVVGVPRDKASTALVTLNSPYHIPTLVPGVLDFDKKNNDPGDADQWIIKPASAYIMKSNRLVDSYGTIKHNEIVQPIVNAIGPASFRSFILVTSLKGHYRAWVSQHGYGQFSIGEIVTNIGTERWFSLPLFEEHRSGIIEATSWLAKKILNVVKYHTPQKKPGYVLLGVDTLIDQEGQVRIIEINYSPGMVFEFPGQKVISDGVGSRLGNLGYQVLSCFPTVVEYLVDDTNLTHLDNWDYIGETVFTVDPTVQVYRTPKIVDGKRRAFIPDVDDIWSMLPKLSPEKIEAILPEITVIDRSGFPIGMIYKGKSYQGRN